MIAEMQHTLVLKSENRTQGAVGIGEKQPSEPDHRIHGNRGSQQREKECAREGERERESTSVDACLAFIQPLGEAATTQDNDARNTSETKKTQS